MHDGGGRLTLNTTTFISSAVLTLDTRIMATKPKAKAKSSKKAVSRHSNGAKSLGLKAKPTVKTPPKDRLKVRPKREPRRTVIAQPESRSTSPEKVRSKQFANAVHAYVVRLCRHTQQCWKSRSGGGISRSSPGARHIPETHW